MSFVVVWSGLLLVIRFLEFLVSAFTTVSGRRYLAFTTPRQVANLRGTDPAHTVEEGDGPMSVRAVEEASA